MNHLEVLEESITLRKSQLKKLEAQYKASSFEEANDAADRAAINEEHSRIQSMINQLNEQLVMAQRAKQYLMNHLDFDGCCLECGDALNQYRVEKFPEKLRCLDCETT